MATQYYSCEYQGITPGWSDNYNIGLPCQWIDVTGWSPANTTLGTNVNPLGWVCEGSINTDANGNTVWNASGKKTDGQWPAEHRNKGIDIKKCTNTTSAYSNNVLNVPATIPSNGAGYLTSKCVEAGQTIGPKRDCEMAILKPYESCTPGSTINFSCSIPSTAQPQVLRVCEASTVIGAGTACRYMDPSLMANVIILSNGATTFTAECPVARSYGEVGGRYTIYYGPVMNGMDAAAPITCTVTPGAGPLIKNGGFEYNSTRYCGGNTNTRCTGLTDSSLIKPWYLSAGQSYEMDYTYTSFSSRGTWALYLRTGVFISQNVTGLTANKLYKLTFQVAQLPQDSDDSTCQDQTIRTGFISGTTSGNTGARQQSFSHDSNVLGSVYNVMNVTYTFTPQSTYSVITVGGTSAGNCGFVVDSFFLS